MNTLSHNKVIKLLARFEPTITWKRRSSSDVEGKDPFFSGALGREGIQFMVPIDVDARFLRAMAYEIGKRLRSYKNAKGN